MRIDVASIDMVSEVNMVSGLPNGLGGWAYADVKWTGLRVLCVSLAVTSPLAPGVPLCARSRLRHTRPAAPRFVFSTHTGYCGVQRKRGSALFWEGRVTVAPADWLGRSLSVTLVGFPRYSDAQGTICRRPHCLHWGPRTRGSQSPQTLHPRSSHALRSTSLLKAGGAGSPLSYKL